MSQEGQDKILKSGGSRAWYANVPNMLTCLRLVMIIPMVYCFLSDMRKAALGFFLLASLTDLLDGYIARRLQIVSNFGKVMDPLADKLMLLSAVLCLFSQGDLPTVVIVIVFAKELLMITVGAILYRTLHMIIPANVIGKIGTVLFFVAVVLAFLSMYTAPWYLYLMYIAVAFSLFSILQYAWLVWSRLRSGQHTAE